MQLCHDKKQNFHIVKKSFNFGAGTKQKNNIFMEIFIRFKNFMQFPAPLLFHEAEILQNETTKMCNYDFVLFFFILTQGSQITQSHSYCVKKSFFLAASHALDASSSSSQTHGKFVLLQFMS
jgi:hypothetical protein